MVDANSDFGKCGEHLTWEYDEDTKTLTSGERAFNDCRGLKEITFAGEVEEIGERTFYSCTGLKCPTEREEDWCGKEVQCLKLRK